MTPRRIYTSVIVAMSVLTIAWLVFVALCLGSVLKVYRAMDSYAHDLLPALAFGLVTAAVAWLMVMSVTSNILDELDSSRFRKGRCRMCGYDLQSLSHTSPCPECGIIPKVNRPKLEDRPWRHL